jgi:hypothetical protein
VQLMARLHPMPRLRTSSSVPVPHYMPCAMHSTTAPLHSAYTAVNWQQHTITAAYCKHTIWCYIRGLFFSSSDRASKEVRNAREPDLPVAWLSSSPTTTSIFVGSNASVVAEIRACEHGRYDRCSRQMWVTKCNPFSASRRT